MPDCSAWFICYVFCCLITCNFMSEAWNIHLCYRFVIEMFFEHKPGCMTSSVTIWNVVHLFGCFLWFHSSIADVHSYRYIVHVHVLIVNSFIICLFCIVYICSVHCMHVELYVFKKNSLFVMTECVHVRYYD